MCNWCWDRSATNQIDDNNLDNSETGFVLFTRIKSVTNIYTKSMTNNTKSMTDLHQVSDRHFNWFLTTIQKFFVGYWHGTCFTIIWNVSRQVGFPILINTHIKLVWRHITITFVRVFLILTCENELLHA